MGVLLFLAFLGLLGFGIFRSLKIDRKAETASFSAFKFVPFAVPALLFLFLALSFTTIDAGQIGVVKRWGNPVRQLDPGPHFVIPVADSITPVIVQTRIVKPSEDAASRDLQVVTFEITFAYHIDPLYATNVLVRLNNDPETRVIDPAILEAIKATTADYDVQDLVAKRQQVRDKIEDLVKVRLEPYHIVAETTAITNFSFSKQYEDSIEAKVTAQQLFEKSQNDLKRVQVEADQKVAAAEGEAKALAVQKQQITPELLQLRTIEMLQSKWDGHLPENYYGGTAPLPMMDVLKNSNANRPH